MLCYCFLLGAVIFSSLEIWKFEHCACKSAILCVLPDRSMIKLLCSSLSPQTLPFPTLWHMSQENGQGLWHALHYAEPRHSMGTGTVLRR